MSGEAQFVRPLDPARLQVLESAAHLQRLVPEAVLVGGTSSAGYAGRRLSLDHDQVVVDLRLRFDAVLAALSDDRDWRLNRQLRGVLILGSLDGIEAGVRQLKRDRPLEVRAEQLPSGAVVTVPTPEEALRVKGYLVAIRNSARDYLDVAALADRHGIVAAAEVLAHVDAYYTDPDVDVDRALATQLTRMLHVSEPRDPEDLDRLTADRGLESRWRRWDEVRRVNREVAARMSEVQP